MKYLTSIFIATLIFCHDQILNGQTWLLKIDTLQYEAMDGIIEMPDKSLIFALSQLLPSPDTTYQFFIGKIDSSGHLLWLKKKDGIIGAVKLKTLGKKIYIIGYGLPSSDSEVGLVLDENGETLALEQLGEKKDYFRSFDRATNGDLLITGYSPTMKGSLLIRTDSLFNEKWRLQLDIATNLPIEGEVVSAFPNDEIGVWIQDGQTITYKRLDGSGNLIFQTKNTINWLGLGFSVRFLPSKNFGLICVQEFNSDGLKIARLDSLGNLLFEKPLLNSAIFSNILYVFDIEEHPNENISIAIKKNDNEMALLNYTADGYLQGQLIYQKPTINSFALYDLSLLRGGGMTISGRSYGTPADSIFIINWDTNPVPKNENLVTGRLFVDAIQNCQKDSSEVPMVEQMVVATHYSEDFFAVSDSTGFYKIYLPSGESSIKAIEPSLFFSSCSDVSVGLNENDTLNIDFGLKPEILCPYLTTELTIPRLRRCFSNLASVHFCNLGTIPADPAHLDLTLDPWLELTAASQPFTALGGNVFRFELGEMAVFECRDIGLTIKVDCDSTILGQTHCVEAHIFPDSSCLPPSATWSGASIEVDASCTNDTLRFFIQNTGTAPTSVPCDFIVFEDDVIMNVGQQSLGIGETFSLEYPADGHFWRLEASQEPGHPGPSMPSVSVEGCNGWWPGSFGFWTAFPQDDGSPAVDIDCLQNIGSYDPNEKTAAPEGIDNQHFIQKNTDIEYTIHFQNTGTDTAFTVVVTDTIDQKLRPEMLKLGGASHPFSWEISGPGILKMTFEKINLPDSTTNLAGSQGWFSYRISQKPDLVDGSQIRNRAAIFFDFNAPILTNRTLHTIGSNFLTVKTWSPAQPDVSLKVFPNPVTDEAVFLIKGGEIGEDDALVLQLFDVNGRLALAKNFTKNTAVISRAGLPGGLYFFKIMGKNGRFLGAGKLVIE